MMISVDGMISGPQGELEWIAGDGQLERAHKATLEQADVAISGAGSYPDMSSYWMDAEK